MSKLLSITVALLLIVSAKAQQNQVLFESTLWLTQELKDSTALQKKKASQQLLNFNRQLNFSKSQIKQHYASFVNKKSSLFFVYRSSPAQENDLITLQCGPSKTTITSKRIIADKETVFDKSSPEQGTIISHIFNRQSQFDKYGKLSFSDILFNDGTGDNTAYEIIYMPRCVNETEKNSIESYLSIKYGISLIGEKCYTNHNGDTIWSYKENEVYKNRVTGLGRDDKSKLYQKQSGNSTKDGLYISLGKISESNDKNPSPLQDGTFLLWGDNGLKTNMKEEYSSLVKMDRVWKAVKHSKQKGKLTTQVLIKNKEMKFVKSDVKDSFIWLVMDTISSDRIDYSRSAYHKASIQNDSISVFNGIEWSSKNTLFTFIQGPSFMVDYNLTSCSCNPSEDDGKSEIVMLNGTAPFTLKVRAENFNKDIVSQKQSYLLEGLSKGIYSLHVTDAIGQSYSTDFTIDPFADNQVSIAPEWYLFTGEITKVKAIQESDEEITYQWLTDGRLLHTGSEFEPSKEGNYIMKATNTSGCSKEIPFRVLDSPQSHENNYSVYPNPCKANQWFTITGTSDLALPTTISVFDMNGRILISKDLGMTADFTYRDSLPQSATYLVIVSAGDQRNVVKLIIN